LSSLRSRVRRRVKFQNVGDHLRSSFRPAEPTKRAGVAAKGLVSIEGRMYPASISDDVPVGSTLEVYNAGRPAAALYVPKVGSGAAVIGGAGGGGGGDAGGGMEVHTLDGEYHGGLLSWSNVNKATSSLTDIVTRPHSATTGRTENDHHYKVTTVAGSGIDLTGTGGQVISVDVTDLIGTGLDEDASNNLKIDLDHAFVWGVTGSHTFNGPNHFNYIGDFNAGLQVDGGTADINVAMDIEGQVNLAANLVFDGGTPLITTINNKNLTLAAHGTGDIRIDDTTTFRSVDYEVRLPYIEGWSIWPVNTVQSQMTISKLYLDELYTRVFVADEVRVDRGDEVWAKSYGIVSEEQDSGTVGGSAVTVWFEDSAVGSDGYPIFSDGDWLMMRMFDDSGGGMDISTNWYTVSGYVDGTVGNGHENEQSWELVLIYGTSSKTMRKGQLMIDFGSTGQGVIHLSALKESDGPWMNFYKWTGNPYTELERKDSQSKMVIGNLDGFSDDNMNLSGWGLYAQNAFLQGELRAGDSIVSASGIQFYTAETAAFVEEDAVRWFRATDDYEYMSLRGWFDPNGDFYSELNSFGYMDYNADLNLFATGQGSGDAQVDIKAASSTSSATLRLWTDASAAENGVTWFIDEMYFNMPNDGLIRYGGSGTTLRPAYDGEGSLGTHTVRWGTVYADAIVADTITGSVQVTTSLGGQTWNFDNSHMHIHSDSADARWLYITNFGAGDMSVQIQGGNLVVNGNIQVTGLVDGIDLQTFGPGYAAHLASTDAHHAKVHTYSSHWGTVPWAEVNKTGSSLSNLATRDYEDLTNRSHLIADSNGLGDDHTIAGASDGWVLRANSGTGAKWQQLSYSDLAGTPSGTGGVHVLATSSALGSEHSVSGLTAGHVLKALSATTAAFGALSHSSIASVTANQHHNEAHAYDDAVHTGTLSYTNIDFSGMSVSNIGTVAHSDLTGVGANDHHNAVTAGNGISLSTQQVSVNLAPTPGLEFFGTGLRIKSTLGGAGLSYASGVMSVGSGDGISVSADAVAVDASAMSGDGIAAVSNNFTVDESYAFVWTGAHTFSNTMTTRHIRPVDNELYDIGASDAWYRSQFVSTINATVFAENTISVVGGWFYVAKYQGVFAETVAYNDTVINFGTGTGTLAVGDFIKVMSHEAQSGILSTEYMTLVSYADPYWTVTRDTAAAHGVDPDWEQGTPWVLLGNVGDGRIEMTAGGVGRSRLSITEQGATWSTQTERLRMGNLYGTGIIGAVDTYGLVAGNDVALTAATGFSGFALAGASGLSIYGADIEGYDTTSHTLHIDGQTGVISVAALDDVAKGLDIHTTDVDTGTKVGSFVNYASLGGAAYSRTSMNSFSNSGPGNDWGYTHASINVFDHLGAVGADFVLSYHSEYNKALASWNADVYSINMAGNFSAGTTYRGFYVGTPLTPDVDVSFDQGIAFGLINNASPGMSWDGDSTATMWMWYDTILFDAQWATGYPANPTLAIDHGNTRLGVGKGQPAAALHVVQTGASDTVPVLQLEQLDTSEEFINFVAASEAVTTAAVGTYYGKVRVAVNGVHKWVAVYN
jgi:hypothetical protein